MTQFHLGHQPVILMVGVRPHDSSELGSGSDKVLVCSYLLLLLQVQVLWSGFLGWRPLDLFRVSDLLRLQLLLQPQGERGKL